MSDRSLLAGSLQGNTSDYGMVKRGHSSYDKLDEPNCFGSRWYFSRKEIEENSPSRRDGIELKKEKNLRNSYCSFLQDLGMRLKLPQVTIATAIVFCHRFFLRQSHAKNDRRIIAIACLFLAGKVEDTSRPLKDVILVSCEIIYKKEPSAVQKIKQKEVYEQQKELIVLGERVVLATLGFDLNVLHPYKPLVEAIKKFKVSTQNSLAQAAWNFVNDGLRTSLCLQYKPHHIAAGAVCLAAKFLKVKLPSDVEKGWWQEFDVTPRQLEDVSNQMLELYEQNRSGQSSHSTEVEGNIGGSNNEPIVTTSSVGRSSVSTNGHAQDAVLTNVEQGGQTPGPAWSFGSQSYADSNHIDNHCKQGQGDGKESAGCKSEIWDHNMGAEGNDCSSNEFDKSSDCRENTLETSCCSKPDLPLGSAVVNERDKVKVDKELMDAGSSTKSLSISRQISDFGETAKIFFPPDSINRCKTKAALEKQRRLQNNGGQKRKSMDEHDDLITRDGCELPCKLASQRAMVTGRELEYMQQCHNRHQSCDTTGSRGNRLEKLHNKP
ncbi:cyclin-T1-3-like [Musa acuminata AAA Group]|uniref:cyclin-T1-3-like n=1 Tax=Musa acuminata AAA Group TaxID=214697 RepID=UPI0031D12AAA